MALLLSSSLEVEVISGILLGMMLMFLLIKNALAKRNTSYLLCLQLVPQTTTYHSGKERKWCLQRQGRIKKSADGIGTEHALILEYWIDHSDKCGNILSHEGRYYISYSFDYCQDEEQISQVDVRRVLIPPSVYRSLMFPTEDVVKRDTDKIQAVVRYMKYDAKTHMLQKVIEFNINKYRKHRSLSCGAGFFLVFLFLLFASNNYNRISLLCIFVPFFLGVAVRIIILNFEVFKCLKQNDDILIYRKDHLDQG